MDTEALPTKGFINEHLTYTHGMGLTLGPSNEVTAEGLPVLFIKDLPPVSSVALPIKRPQIYYGEQSNDFVLAPSRQREFDYPAGEGDAAVYSTYDGRGGVPVASFAARLLYALHFGSFNILLSRDVTDRTRILYNRSVGERARRALPFLLFDRDPYMVVASDGRLKWLLDGYTTTDRYPYSQRARDGTNYMRNSVKVVIDAYDGSTTFYVFDSTDPIIDAYRGLFPGLFKDAASMTVGTHNTIEDFSQSQHDQIKFVDVAGVQSFNDLVIAQSATGTVITAGADQVTLHNFTGSLTANDFLFV